MIIGNGNIAKALNDREGAIFFASGVSNSKECHDAFFSAEHILLMSQPRSMCLFYFSTISIYYKVSPYTNFKIKMEQEIRNEWINHNIIRLGNLDWDTNPNTFVNALRAKKAKGEPFEILDEYRYMISREELLLLTDNLPLTGRNEINVFGRMAKVKDLL